MRGLFVFKGESKKAITPHYMHRFPSLTLVTAAAACTMFTIVLLPPPPPFPPSLSVHWVTWVLWAVSPPISSRGELSWWISGPRESNADMLRQLRSDWEGSAGLSTICISATLLHTETHPLRRHAREHGVFAHPCVCDLHLNI